MNPLYEIMLTAENMWKEKSAAQEVVGISIDIKDVAQTLRSGLPLSMTWRILINEQYVLDPLVISKAESTFSVMGKQAIYDHHKKTGPILSELLKWPRGIFLAILYLPRGGVINISRAVDGSIKVSEIQSSTVLTGELRLNTPHFLVLLNIMIALHQPVEKKDFHSLQMAILPAIGNHTCQSPASHTGVGRENHLEEMIEGNPMIPGRLYMKALILDAHINDIRITGIRAAITIVKAIRALLIADAHIAVSLIRLTIQHLTKMQDRSNTIIASSSASIVQVEDYRLSDALFDAIPPIIRVLKKILRTHCLMASLLPCRSFWDWNATFGCSTFMRRISRLAVLLSRYPLMQYAVSGWLRQTQNASYMKKLPTQPMQAHKKSYKNYLLKNNIRGRTQRI